jgi:hypothetical protein
MVVIKDDRTFVPVGRQEVCRFGSDKGWTPGPRLIACAWAFHFDNVRAEVAQQHGAIRAGERFGQFYNPDFF